MGFFSKERLLLLFLGMFVALTMIGFAVGPSIAERSFNPSPLQTLPPLSDDVADLHKSLTVADLHADSLLWGRDLSVRSEDGYVDISRLLEGNVALQMFTVVTKVPTPLQLEGNADDSDNIIKLALLQRWPVTTWSSLKSRALYQARRLHNYARESSGQFSVIKTQGDLAAYLSARENNRQLSAGLLGLEGAHALEGNLDNVDRLFDLGFRMIGLAHFFDNEVGSSAHGLKQERLTPFGREVLKRSESLNMMIDLSHASVQTIDDVLAIARRPVMVSHTGVRGTCDNGRNLSDQQLQQIAQTGGLVAIGFWSTAVCGESVDDIVRAIAYTTDQIGIDHVALGSDFDGAVQLPFDVANIGQVTKGLLEAGFTQEDIQKIMGLNAVRFLEKMLPA
ncbi:MAG: dipeptidase [Cyanobacteria bacterium J06631_9]